MGKIAIVTDSNSGIQDKDIEGLDIFVVPMPFELDGELYMESESLDKEELYKLFKDGVDVSTSQPSPGYICELWDKLLEEYEEILYIPMSSALSSTCQTGFVLAQDYDNKVQVVDNKRISVILKESVYDALYLSHQGKSAKEIKETLEEHQGDGSIYLMVDTLTYLKKGGRITSGAAALGAVLNLKPILQIQGGKLDAYAKARGIKQARKILLDALEKDLKERFAGEKMTLYAAHSCTQEDAELWKVVVQERFPDCVIELWDLSMSITCHVGPGVLAVATAKSLQ